MESKAIKVSILMAARNEASNILDCLYAMDALHSEKATWDVWIGNDASEDDTETLIREFIADKPHFHLINIEKSLNGLKGKTNVLVQLEKLAIPNSNPDYLLFTDADIQVPPSWIDEMLPKENEASEGMITAATTMIGGSLFHRLQGLDWLVAFFFISEISKRGKPLTALGNNLLVHTQTYLALGGFSTLGETPVEDYALCQLFKNNGINVGYRFCKETLCITKPCLSYTALFRQRRRWMQGALDTPFWIKSLLILNALTIVGLLLGFLFFPIPTMTIWEIRLFFLWMVQYRIHRRLDLVINPFDFLAFDIYLLGLNFSLLFYYLWTPEIKWKGRTFKNKPQI